MPIRPLTRRAPPPTPGQVVYEYLARHAALDRERWPEWRDAPQNEQALWEAFAVSLRPTADDPRPGAYDEDP